MSNQYEEIIFENGRRAVLRQIVGLTALSALPFHCLAQSYPARPIRMIVPFPPGGGFDSVARPIAEKMGKYLKQTIVVDNKGGAGGNIGAGEAARSTPDGYTILFANEILCTNPNTYKSVPFDPIKSFEPIALVATTPLALAINPNLPAKNLTELIALSAKDPITYGTPGIGTSPHLFGELLNLQTTLKLRHIPYKGTGQAITDAIGGQVGAVLSVASSLAPYIKSEKLRGIAIMSDKRSAVLPDLPTLAEEGLPGNSHDVWYAIVAPAGTPKSVLAQLSEATKEVLKDKDLIEQLRKMGFEPTWQDGKVLAEKIKIDLGIWNRVVAEAKLDRQ